MKGLTEGHLVFGRIPLPAFLIKEFDEEEIKELAQVMHEAKCPSPVYVILTTHTTREEYLQDDDVQMRRVGRTTDIALRVNAHTKREIGSVQSKSQDYAEGNRIGQKRMSDQISRAEGSHAAGSASHRGGIQLEASYLFC